MNARERRVLPEALDDLAADDPRGQRSRRDLRRVHRAMRSVSILLRAVAKLRFAVQPTRVLELGAGDGTLLLRLAQALRPRWNGVDVTLLDRHDLVSDDTRAEFRKLDWRVTVLRADALVWAAVPPPCRYDVCFANLFLHHFDAAALALLLRGVAAASAGFVACEPRRGGLARSGSRLVCFLGANEVTREDAVKSVDAGFTGRELSEAWATAGSAQTGWITEEYLARPFTHCFTAILPSARGGGS